MVTTNRTGTTKLNSGDDLFTIAGSLMYPSTGPVELPPSSRLSSLHDIPIFHLRVMTSELCTRKPLPNSSSSSTTPRVSPVIIMYPPSPVLLAQCPHLTFVQFQSSIIHCPSITKNPYAEYQHKETEHKKPAKTNQKVYVKRKTPGLCNLAPTCKGYHAATPLNNGEALYSVRTILTPRYRCYAAAARDVSIPR